MTREVLATLLRWIVPAVLVVVCVACGADAPEPLVDAATGAELDREPEFEPLVLDEPRVLRVLQARLPITEGTPLSGAEVTVEYDDGSIVMLQSDANGRVELGREVGRMVSVRAHAPGRVRHGWFRDPDYHWGLPPHQLVLMPGMELEGRVVRSDDGTPIEGAAVIAIARSWFGAGRGPEQFPFQDRARTDADGRFELRGVPSSAQQEWVLGMRPVRLWVECVGFVEASRSPRVDAGAARADPIVFALDSDSPIHGVVRDPEGSAVAGAEVHTDVVRYSFDHPLPPARVVTDERGRFSVRGYRPGARLSLTATSADLADSEPVTVVTPSVAPVVLELRRDRLLRLRVTDEEGNDVDECSVHAFREHARHAGTLVQRDSPLELGPLPPGRTALAVTASDMASSFQWLDDLPADGQTLHVVLAQSRTVEGRVTDDGGRPVYDAYVQVGPADTAGHAGVPYLVKHAETDEDGRFVVERLGPGELVAQVWHADHERLVVALGAAESRIDVRLDRLGSVEATLVAPRGHPLPPTCGVYLSDEQPAHPAAAWVDSRVPDVAHELAAPTLIVRRIPPGRRTLDLRMAGFRGVQIDVDVPPGRRVQVGEVVLDPGLTLRGRVEDPSGRPVPHARVRSERHDWSGGDTDGEGVFRMAELAAGMTRLTVESAGLFGWATVDVDADTWSQPVTIRTERTRPVRVRVRDADGNPLPGRWCVATHEASQHCVGAQLDAAGTADLELLPGRHTVVVRDADDHEYEPVTMLIEPIPDGEDAGADITIRVR